MESQLLFDMVFTTITCFSLVGLLAIAAIALPWRDEELREVEASLAKLAHGATASTRSMVIPMKGARRIERTVRPIRRAA